MHANGYSEDIVNAGLLHDMVEWTEYPQQTIREAFGDHVYKIVLANTKNREITDPSKRRQDYVDRCAQIEIDALIVKAADTLDSYEHYSEQKNTAELERCACIAKLILEKIDVSADPIFEKLKGIMHNEITRTKKPRSV